MFKRRLDPENLLIRSIYVLCRGVWYYDNDEAKLTVPNFSSSRPKVFCKKGVLRNFAKFTGKHLAKVFSCEFCEVS